MDTYRIVTCYHTMSRQSAHISLLGYQPYESAALYSPEVFISVSGTHFCQRLMKSQGPSAAGRIR
jgi:hypothetical protein